MILHLFQEYEKRLNLEEFGDPDEEFTQRKIVAKFMTKVNFQLNLFPDRHLHVQISNGNSWTLGNIMLVLNNEQEFACPKRVAIL